MSLLGEGLGISGVMSKGGISSSVISTEDIEIGYYSNAKIELKDRETRTLKASYMLADAPGQ